MHRRVRSLRFDKHDAILRGGTPPS
jgi:hypothetical protein